MAGFIDVIRSDILPIVNRVSPLIGGVLGGPLASIGISWLANAFGVDEKNPDQLATVIKADPEAAIKIRSIEYAHQEALQSIDVNKYGIEVDDRKDARRNSVQYKDFMRHLAYCVTIGFFGTIVLISLPFQVSDTEKNLLSMLVGILASKWQTIIDFFYGSSRQNNSNT